MPALYLEFSVGCAAAFSAFSDLPSSGQRHGAKIKVAATAFSRWSPFVVLPDVVIR
ncbi:MAG: hypothetical protein IPO38_04975 [Rhodocyclaceae bacterium]|nr:hypothetical protein [Rhodocyclaceae bacterium]